MTDVNFYHLQQTSLEKTLPRLLEKILAADKRAVLTLESPENVVEMDAHLWTYSPGSFLPHGAEKDGFEKNQPIWLTTSLENPNDASVLVVMDGKQVDNFRSYDKCLDLFNGHDVDAINKARTRWQSYQQAGHALTYWFQNEAGAWHKRDQSSL